MSKRKKIYNTTYRIHIRSLKPTWEISSGDLHKTIYGTTGSESDNTNAIKTAEKLKLPTQYLKTIVTIIAILVTVSGTLIIELLKR